MGAACRPEITLAITSEVSDTHHTTGQTAAMSAFPNALKTWRKARRLSQLDLAVEAEVSARHISFLETGRAQPSRDMIGRLGDALQLPLTARNQLLSQAGFAARYPSRHWDDTDMAPIRAAIEHMLERHAPFPGIALDRLWNLVRLNRPAEQLYAQLGLREGDSLLDLMTSDVLPSLIENWAVVAHHTVQRLRTESAAQGGVPELDQAADMLSAGPTPIDQAVGPVVPTILRTPTMRLSLFGTIAQFGTPEDVALDDLKIELFYPADDATRNALTALAAATG